MAKKIKIAIDLDDTLSSLIAEFIKWHNREYNTIWEYADATDYHWEVWMGTTEEYAVRTIHKFFETPEFANLPVLSGAKDWINSLKDNYDLYIVTARQSLVEDITREWINKNFPNTFQDIVLGNHYALDGTRGPSKGELCEKLGCKVLVDDNIYHIDSLLKRGIKTIILDRPWNRSIKLSPGVIRAHTWEEATQAVTEHLSVATQV
jgi:uncharacterized protein